MSGEHKVCERCGDDICGGECGVNTYLPWTMMQSPLGEWIAHDRRGKEVARSYKEGRLRFAVDLANQSEGIDPDDAEVVSSTDLNAERNRALSFKNTIYNLNEHAGKLNARIAELEAIVKELNTTEDGVPITPGMSLYFPNHLDKDHEPLHGNYPVCYKAGPMGDWKMGPSWHRGCMVSMFASKEKARQVAIDAAAKAR